MVHIGMVYSRGRVEEKMLQDAARQRGVALTPVQDDSLILDLDAGALPYDVVLERSVSYTRGLYVLKFCRAHGVPAVNRYEVAQACGDKTETSLLLRRAGVPTPNTKVAFDPEAALRAIEQIGYPAVLKPTLGSWARMVARVDSRREAEQLLEHREQLPNPVQQVYYIQEYVKKETPAPAAVAALPQPLLNGAIPNLAHPAGPGAMAASNASAPSSLPSAQSPHFRDMRAFVVGDETICAIWRTSPHWITNTARGGKATVAPVDAELNELCLRAAQAVGGGVLALDLMEGPNGLTCHEINHTMEFRNSVQPTGVDIPGKIIDFCVREAKQ
ncbi:MAG TPA: RimK family alpha-L-glutamate ligase [Candidatus Thermoplasmatota archaeon]|nr:RimK family alpha-L-glutamate ligase [Candidatus Thermoplasmatota archaeon]